MTKIRMKCIFKYNDKSYLKLITTILNSFYAYFEINLINHKNQHKEFIFTIFDGSINIILFNYE